MRKRWLLGSTALSTGVLFARAAAREFAALPQWDRAMVLFNLKQQARKRARVYVS